MLVPLSSPQQGDGEEDRSSSSSDSDLEEVTSPQLRARAWLPLAPHPCGVCTTNPSMDATKYLGWDTQHSPHMLCLLFLFQDQGIAKDDEKEDKD